MEGRQAVRDRGGVAEGGAGIPSNFPPRTGTRCREEAPFLKALGLRSEAPQTFTPKGWLSLLETYGPLWVTTQLKRERQSDEKFSVHARVVVGMYQRDEGGDFFFRVIDPEAGTRHDESLDDFIRRYENIAREDLTMGTEFQPQVIHF